MQWLAQNPEQPLQEHVTSALGGVFDKDLNIYIATPTDTMTSVGLSSFGGVGTGRPVVGTSMDQSRNVGIILSEQKDKRWLSIDTKWVEGDPLNSEIKQILRHARDNINGIFITPDGNYKKTDGAVYPDLLGLKRIKKSLNQTEQTCAQIQMKNINNNSVQTAQLCDHITSEKAEYILTSAKINVNLKIQNDMENNLQISAEINQSRAEALSLRRMKNQQFNVKFEGLSGFEIEDKRTLDRWIGPIK